MLLARLVALKTRLTVSRVANGSVTKLVASKEIFSASKSRG